GPFCNYFRISDRSGKIRASGFPKLTRGPQIFPDRSEIQKKLQKGMEKLRSNQLYTKFSKCEFWLTEVAFLGHVISAGGVSVDPGKVKDVLNWMPPATVLDIRSFLGLAGYYR
ncbi:hypothetical protein, partial [Arcobacter sp.]|uniref:hypothetical protein n=1 Tax=Arcobacter sp. TaxID=1872629 RepID=UPI003D0F0A34